jgi:hypothetical protein
LRELQAKHEVLQRDLRRKERALAEAAALLVLQKKFQALLGNELMSGAQQRKELLELIGQACTAGARLKRACAQVGLSERTVQRWQHPDGQDGDHRASGLHERAEPPNKLSAFERPARSFLAWPTKGATSPVNRPCIGYCTRPAR